MLSSPDIVTRPTGTDINNTIVHSVKDFLERIKDFRRWMDGTCLLCEPVMSGDGPYTFSFFEDVMQVDLLLLLIKYTLNTKTYNLRTRFSTSSS